MRSGVQHPLSLIRAGLASCLFAVSFAVAGSAPLPARMTAVQPEFQFIRMIYASNPDFGYGGFGGFGGFGRGGGSWTTDMPEAEEHFLQGMKRLTRINAADESKALQLLDDEIFNYPFIYAVEVGRWSLSNEEAARLREYLLRGGFLMVDDFHGSLQWEGFMESMRRVFPDRPVVEIPESHETFHVAFDLNQRVQIPGVAALMNGSTYEQDGVEPHWRGIFDDDGRLMVAINFNMDMGDAWEHADTPGYPHHMTALAYRFGIDYVLYTMTH